MSLLVMGVSHRTAPLEVLERCAMSGDDSRGLAAALLGTEHVSEAAVLATCNRLEVYAEVGAFHGGLVDIGSAMVARTGLDLGTLTAHMYAHYGDHAVNHLVTVACGRDSMAIGESQVLGQVREMLRTGQETGTVSRALDPLLQQALRVGKRAFSETELSTTGHNLVDSALQHAAELGIDLTRASGLVIGAGAMSALAGSRLRAAGVHDIAIANRSAERAQRLAESVDGRWLLLSEGAALTRALADADVVITCTGAVGHVLTLKTIAKARERRAWKSGGQPAPQLLVDLALPRDVAPEVAQLPGVSVVDLAELGQDLSDAGIGDELEAVRGIVRDEVAGYLQAQRVERVAPTVVALRQYAARVVESELDRFRHRVTGLDQAVNDELERTVHRVVEKLLHRPTVRVKSLAAESDGGRYADALRELFDLPVDEAGGGASVPQVSALLSAGTPDALAVGIESDTFTVDLRAPEATR